MDQHLQRQMAKTGMSGYELHVLHVADQAASSSAMAKLEALYPRHSYSTVPFSKESISRAHSQEAIGLEDLTSASASARADLTAKLLTRVVASSAETLSCSSILLGDTMSKLSERTLAETSKGRGFALPQLLGQTATVHGIPCIYPLRDLFRTEIEQYIQHIAPTLWRLSNQYAGVNEIKQHAVSTKDLSIDQLLAQYVADVERQLPNIVANVVRTGARLEEEDGSSERRCPVCGFRTISQGLADQVDVDEEHAEPTDISLTSLALERCHGCARSVSECR